MKGETMNETVLAWHFVGKTLRDGRPVPPDGEWLEHVGPVILCSSGLHASIEPFDALQYAPGSTLCRVEVSGETAHDTDKLVASRRRILSRIDATRLLRRFAADQALSVAHLWEMPVIVRDYLESMDESKMAAARAAAWDAARAAARAAAKAAAWAAANAAANDAANDAANAAARAAANAAAWAEANAAAWAAARAAARTEFNIRVTSIFEKAKR